MSEHDALRQACGATAVTYEDLVFSSMDMYLAGVDAAVVL